MITISKKYSFDAAHQLWRNDWTAQENKQVFGKCSRMHGHTYELEVTVSGPVNSENGMILNYFDLDAVVKPLVEDLDHEILNDVFGNAMLTTSENMVTRIAHSIADDLEQTFGKTVQVASVRLSETPKTSAIWYATV